jgi:hypothetical protein
VNLEQLESRLKGKNATELKYLLMDVYSRFPEVKDYLDIAISSNQKENQLNLEKLKKRYKTLLTKYLCPNVPEEVLDEERAINLINLIRKNNLNIRLTIECELYFLNCCKDFVLNYGYFDEDFYNTLDEVFKRLSDSIFENHLEEDFKEDFKEDIESLIQFGHEYGLEFREIWRK